MPSKMTDATLTKRLTAARKELAALDARRARAEATLASFDADRTELAAEEKFLTELATNRGLDTSTDNTTGTDVPDEEPVESWV